MKFVLPLKKEKCVSDLGISGGEKKSLDGLKIVNYMYILLMHLGLSMQKSLHFILENILMMK